MANAITSVATFDGLNDSLYLKPFTNDPDVAQLGFDVKVAKVPLHLYFNTQLSKITKEKVACGWDFQGGANVTKKTLTPVELAAAIEQCYTVFMQTYFAEGLPAGAARGELSAEIVDILQQLHFDANKQDLLRMLFLGNTGSASADYNAFDGVYQLLGASSSPDVGALVAADFNSTNIVATMAELYNAQSRIMKGIADNRKKFLVTGNIYDAWVDYLISVGQNFNQAGLINGVSQVAYRGIEMVPLRWVDAALAADFTTGSPAVVTNPYRAILTVPDNHKLLLDKSSFGDAKAWYSMDDDVFRVAGSGLYAYQFGYDDLNVIGGF
jgi:hypothetical protein